MNLPITRHARSLILAACFLAAPGIAQAEPSLAAPAVQALIDAAEPGTRDSAGWAKDLLSVLAETGFARSPENVCSAIAILDQESGFRANPAVPGLGEASARALSEKLNGWSILGSELRDFLSTEPDSNNSYMKRILKARTERDLDLAYRDAMTALVTDAGLTDLLATRLATDLFENQNDIRTIGSMQVSVDFAIATEEAARGKPLSLDDIHRLRDRLYTRKGGMHYGVLQLLGYQTGYDRKVYRFADYNAGRYASRNAALQHAVSRLSGRPLALDGDMLAYGSDGMALGRRSSTELAILSIARSLGLTDRQIRKDLRQEKHQDFTSTQTFKRIRHATGHSAQERQDRAPDDDSRLRAGCQRPLSKVHGARRIAERLARSTSPMTLIGHGLFWSCEVRKGFFGDLPTPHLTSGSPASGSSRHEDPQEARQSHSRHRTKEVRAGAEKQRFA